MTVKIHVRTLYEDSSFNMELRLMTSETGLSRSIEHPRIQKPGIALAGYVESLRPNRVQVLGKTEINFLDSLSIDERRSSLSGFFSQQIACICVTTGLELPEGLQTMAEEEGVALFVTPLVSSTFINRVNSFLDEHLSPEISLHGVLLDVFGVGIVITGQSGIGKSECALDLVLRGHRLVADDMVIMRQQGATLVGRGSPMTRHHMEVRGLGIINVRDLFGAASVCAKKTVSLIVDMTDWKPEESYDRTGIEDRTERVLQTDVTKITLPLRPGRNVASIIEVAARNHLLKQQGYNSAQAFKTLVEQRLTAVNLANNGDNEGMP
jgi:HPr kinase/phosphorylase